MRNKKGAALLAQTRPQKNEPSVIISTISDDVKLKGLLSRTSMTRKELIRTIREYFPLFDKTALSKCLNPQKYGVVLHPEALDILTAGVEIEPEEEHPHPMKGLSQCDKILLHFERYGSITALVAMREYGIMRLASRIIDLRKRGYLIEKVTECGKNRYGETTNYARYWLRKEAPKDE